MTNALIIFVLISVSLSASIISVASSSSYDMGYTSCSDEEIFLVLWNIPISQCVRECHARSICAAVNYWTRSSGCELLNSDGGLKIYPGSTNQPCVYTRKADYQVSIPCPTCDQPYVCDLNTGSCLIKECSKLQIENAVILGNMLSVGAKVLIQCEESHSLVPPTTPTSICQSDSTWSNETKCIVECNIRKACLAVNYWSWRSQCDMLLDDTETPLQQENNTQPCVFVKKKYFDPAAPLTCQSCDDRTVYDIDSGDCVYKECRQLLVQNAKITDNILAVGSKIRIYCNSFFAQQPNETLSICQENETWSNVPTCHYLYDCDEPPIVNNATVSPGTITQGSERSYTCNADYSDINNVPMTVTCQQGGTWTVVAFECVQDCDEPPGVDNAAVSPGAIEQGSERIYTCNAGYIDINNASMTVICQQGGTWTEVAFECVQDTVCPPDILAFHQAVLQDGTVIQYRAFFDASSDFAEARAKCEEVGGGLYQILTPAKMDFTLELMTCPEYQSTAFWVNGVYNQATSVWETTDGTQITMTFWNPDMPNNDGATHSCIWISSIFGYTWDDRRCVVMASYPTYALCELF